ncbi:MAG: flagellar protein FliT [Gammaproteobacteria bacterium]|nr:flagellar protein FliT [Gammaproteobacteria bacterium]
MPERLNMSIEMQSFSTQQHAEHLLRLSLAMLQFAEDGDWESFSQFEIKRQAVVDSLFSHPDIGTNLIHVAPVLEQIIELDAESMAMGKIEMDRLRGQLNTMHNRQHASKAYQQTSGY